MMITVTDRDDSLINIDNIFSQLSFCNIKDKPAWLSKYLEAIACKVNGALPKDFLNYLFDKNISSQNRRFIAISLLRLFTVKDFSFDINRRLHINTFALFDEVLSNDIYPKYKINKDSQTYEKERILRDITINVEKNLEEVIESLNNLRIFDVFRKKFMQTIGNNITKAILIPYLPKQLLTDARLKELFDYIDDYLLKRSTKKLKTLEKALEAQNILKKYGDDAKNYGTNYAKLYLLALADKLYNLIEEDIQLYDGTKPAQLCVYKSDKKYPLHDVGRKIYIEIKIENKGPGYAFNVELKAHSPIENIIINQPLHHLGRLDPSIQDFRIEAEVVESEEIALLEIDILWKNFDNSSVEESFTFELSSQRTDLDWISIEREQPYSLEPIEAEDELVGREDIIKQLVRQSCAKSIGSSYIFGQKRVGKTSIVKTLKSRLLSVEYLIIYLEGGDYVCPESKDTIHELGKKLINHIKIADKRFSHIPAPEFNYGSLTPLIDFLDSILAISPDISFLFILDEFDKLPIELYKRGPLGDSFFLSLRSISGKPRCGFLLVGGERMELIMSCQGDALNKFRSMRVDYFDREKYWNDFQSLIRNPVKKWFDISDEAIAFLYEQSAGNPFYTKWICNQLFEIMLNRRDSHVTLSEVKEATRESLKEISSNSFQHFWEDGIFETTGDRCEEISIRRRKVLLALACLFREQKDSTAENIIQQDISSQYSSQEIINELNQFVRRHVLYEKDNSYCCKVKFFMEWLIDKGVREIMTTFSDLDSILERKKKEEDAYISSKEIIELISNWGIYKGQKITEDKVRLWLSQFGENINQRLMFKILKGINFYTASRIREKMREAQGIVNRGVTLRKDIGKHKRNDILVSYLDDPGKSGGGIYAKLYADENKIYVDNVVERNKLPEFLKNKKGLNALVFIDDFIGSGRSAKDYFERIYNECGQILIDSGLKIYFIAICGFQDKKSEIEQYLDQIRLPVNVNICDPIDESSKCFSKNSTIFLNEFERNKAKEIAYEHGTKIIKENYLGYGDCQTTIIFETNCPNNNLPILWAECDDPIWYPLFKRL